jgi:hypothetical protein
MPTTFSAAAQQSVLAASDRMQYKHIIVSPAALLASQPLPL